MRQVTIKEFINKTNASQILVLAMPTQPFHTICNDEYSNCHW